MEFEIEKGLFHSDKVILIFRDNRLQQLVSDFHLRGSKNSTMYSSMFRNTSALIEERSAVEKSRALDHR
jgi:hypothetical protein